MALIASILSKFDDTGIRRAKKGFASLKGIMAGIGAGFAIAELKQVGEFMMDAAKAAEADNSEWVTDNDIDWEITGAKEVDHE